MENYIDTLKKETTTLLVEKNRGVEMLKTDNYSITDFTEYQDGADIEGKVAIVLESAVWNLIKENGISNLEREAVRDALRMVLDTPTH